MRHIVDLTNWKRTENFRFFEGFYNPTLSITTEIDCTTAKNAAKKKGQSFFLHYLYAVLHAVNEVDEFRYRIEGDEIAWYDKVDVMTPIQVNEKGKFVTCRIAYHPDFDTFYAEAERKIKSICEDTDPYAEEYVLWKSGHFDVILLSAVPDLYFTSMGYTQFDKNGSKYPQMTVGKVICRNGRHVMPFALCAHHGLIDGFHVGKLFEILERLLK